MTEYSTLAAVDLGSNSFRLQVARVVGDLLYPLDSLRDPVRLAAGLKPDKSLDEAAQERALKCLGRFAERLRGLPPHAVRAVGTNSLRVAKNAPAFLAKAEAALGFPIEVIGGREEARLIYLGVAHELPPSEVRRLVVDIGGGSTECIIGHRLDPIKLESLYMGCVSYSLRHFGDGKITQKAMQRAELAARTELQTIGGLFGHREWQEAYGSSGTARALADILELNGWSVSGITREGLEKLKAMLIRIGDCNRLELRGLRPDRANVLPGGLAIMSAVFEELGIESMVPASGALRQGVLYDLLGRFHHHDMREVTVRQFMQRYHVDPVQAGRVESLALTLAEQILPPGEDIEEHLKTLSWAAKLHEIGISVAHSGYHKHTAYILQYADMPGFSKMQQTRLSLLALGHRGSLAKMRNLVEHPEEWAQILALRTAAILYRSRCDLTLPAMRARATASGFILDIERGWLRRNPLTDTVLHQEMEEWSSLGIRLAIDGKIGLRAKTAV